MSNLVKAHNELICQGCIQPFGSKALTILETEIRRSYIEKHGYDLLIHVEDARISTDIRLTGIELETLTELSNMFHLLQQQLYLKMNQKE